MQHSFQLETTSIGFHCKNVIQHQNDNIFMAYDIDNKNRFFGTHIVNNAKIRNSNIH